MKNSICSYYAVFGNPINQSQSPYIHALFADEIGISHPYNRILVPLDQFEQILLKFFRSGGLGANITLPFKERAFTFCDQLTKRSTLSKVVNTIKKLPNGAILGDNTDGIALIKDLQRLSFLNKRTKILLVGAGGAAQGVIPSLLQYSYKVVITNRTFSKVEKLIKLYYNFSNISAIPIEYISLPNYDLIINATSAGIYGEIPSLPTSIITSKVCCYDMFYSQKMETPFISWSRQHGALRYADGLGMLVHQAALAFLLWRGILPSILPVLKKLRG